MSRWIGVDVGGERKGFDVAVVDERQLIRLIGGLDLEAVLGLVDAERPVVVGIDSPGCCAPAGRTARDCELALARTICQIRWTPDRPTVDRNPYYAWIVEGLNLFEALADRDAELIEVFPTASWTRWLGPRGARSRAIWTGHGVVWLGVDGVPGRTNQDQRDAIAAAVTARQHTEGTAEAIGEIVVPISLPPGAQTMASSRADQPTAEALPLARLSSESRSDPPSARMNSTRGARRRRGPPLDFVQAAAFIAAIPAGRWAAYKDVATAGGNHLGAQAVGEWVRRNGDALPHVYRVIRSSGLVADGYRPAGIRLPRDAASVRDVLRREGVVIDTYGRASHRQRFTSEDWRRAGAGVAES